MPHRRRSAAQSENIMRSEKFITVGLLCDLAALILLASGLAHGDALEDLGRDFWGWRSIEQPLSTDDIPRLERPADWVPDWSAAAVSRYEYQLSDFETRWKRMDPSAWPVAREVDYRLIGSALARVHWELDRLRSWQCNPAFYVDQSVGAYYHLLLPPPPFNPERSRQILAILNSIPGTLEEAKNNLSNPAAPFARLALEELRDIRPRLLQSVQSLKPILDAAVSQNLETAAEKAAAALESYRAWLEDRLPSMSAQTAIGRGNYLYFLRNVALLPYTPEQLLAMGHQEWARAVASQSYEEHRNLGKPSLVLFRDEAEQIAIAEKDELAIRRFLEAKDILTVPSWIEHYRLAPMPAFLAPLDGTWEADDFTGPDRLKENSTRYLVPPSPNLGYFASTMAKDPRALIVHEGVPGHYLQLALSWDAPDPIRRHYYDSGANEGIGFYAEEMLLHAGLFDDSPRSREFIWSFMRLRALRVEVDVKLALGEFNMDQAAEYLKTTVPMDEKTARSEAALFATTPGQAISYEIGKLQICEFLADAHRKMGKSFSLRAFHDFLWQNGNVPISLQRWEYLGLKDEIEPLDRLQ
jgi:Bacterial protein of unknown function (DUF885)